MRHLLLLLLWWRWLCRCYSGLEPSVVQGLVHQLRLRLRLMSITRVVVQTVGTVRFIGKRAVLERSGANRAPIVQRLNELTCPRG